MCFGFQWWTETTGTSCLLLAYSVPSVGLQDSWSFAALPATFRTAVTSEGMQQRWYCLLASGGFEDLGHAKLDHCSNTFLWRQLAGILQRHDVRHLHGHQE